MRRSPIGQDGDKQKGQAEITVRIWAELRIEKGRFLPPMTRGIGQDTNQKL